MNAFVSFTKKEFTENTRTYKLFIMGAAFLLLGMMSPVGAKYLPELLSSLAGEIEIHLPEPTAFDAWAQFFKNIGQMGLVVLVIVYSGTTAGELSKGWLINMLTKGLKRGTVVFAKLTAATVIWTAGYLLSMLVSHAYTAYFWPGYEISNALAAFFAMWLYGELLIALVVLGGVLFANIYGSLLLTGGAAVVLSLLNIVPAIQKYNPVSLSAVNLAWLTAQQKPSDYAPAFIVCAALTMLCAGGSAAVFNKKQL